MSDTATWEAPKQPAASSVRAVVATVAGHGSLLRLGDTFHFAPGRRQELSRNTPSFRPPRGEHRGDGLGDPFISRRPLVLRPLRGGGLSIEREQHPGPIRLDGHEVAAEIRIDAVRLQKGVTLELGPRVVLFLQDTLLEAPAEPYGLVGESAPLQRIRAAVARFGPRREPVLIHGESGTGKELVAQALHRASPAAADKWVAVNMATLVGSMAASELFGHEAGAFTGADRARRGLFERADGGTLFLDEIGATPFDVQAMLLRIIETGRLLRVGGEEEREVQVRLLAATDAPLEEEVESARFRNALFHRVSTLRIDLPALRDRRDDIPRLVAHVLTTAGEGPDAPTWMSSDVVRRFLDHRWPGNVRELVSTVHRLQAGADALQLFGEEAVEPASNASAGSDADSQDLASVLERFDYRLNAAAPALGISKAALYRRIRAHPDLRAARDIPDEELREVLDAHGGSIEDAARALKVSKRALTLRLESRGGDPGAE